MTHEPIIRSLETLRLRVRSLALLLGAGIVFSVLVVGLIAVVLADYSLDLFAWPRCVLICSALAVACYAVWRWIVKAMLSRLTIADVAARIEQTYPQYQDRLRSTVDILTGKPFPGSGAMKTLVVAETSRISQSLDLNRVIFMRPVWYSAIASGMAILLLALCLGLTDQQYLRIAERRLLTPFATSPWPKSVLISMVGSVPDRVAAGSRFDVNIRLARGDRPSRKAIIYYQYFDENGRKSGPEQTEYMTRSGDGVFHSSIDAHGSSIDTPGSVSFRIESGDDSVSHAPVRIVSRLAIQSVEAVITPPAYANLPAVTVSLAQHPARLTEGSKVQLVARFSKPLDPAKPPHVEWVSGSAKPAMQWTMTDALTAKASLSPRASFSFRLHASDTDGFENIAGEEYEFTVQPDQLPSVDIEAPRQDEDRTPEAVFPVQVLAEDDFGIQSLSLAVDRLGDNRHWDIPLVTGSKSGEGVQWDPLDATNETQRFRAKYAWDLSQLANADLKSGDVLQYYVSVTDNFDLDGAKHPAVASAKRRISIVSQETFANSVTDELGATAEQVTALRKAQSSLRSETGHLGQELNGKPAMDDADRAVAQRLNGQQGLLASQAKSLANELAELQTRIAENKASNPELQASARDAGSLLNDTAERSMKQASDGIASAIQAANAADRSHMIEQAGVNQATAIDDMQKAIDRIGNVGILSRATEDVRQLLTDQQKLSAQTADTTKTDIGKKRSELTPDQQKQLDDLASKQLELANKTSATLKKLAAGADKLAKSDPTASAALRKAASAAKSGNVAGAQTNASNATRENQQSQAHEAEQQAEQGLQQALSNLHDAEQQKLAELADKLGDIQQQLATLIREQAGHNLDDLNLLENHGEGQADASVFAQLFIDAGRDPAVSEPPLPVDQLTSAQRQTEQNARSLAEVASGLPDGSESGNDLTQAADLMDRAAIDMVAQKLTDAYTTGQMPALVSLRQAKEGIDKQKESVDKKQEEQKKQTIKEKYSALLESQKELNQKTISIDSSPRNEDGTLSRLQMIKVNALGIEQDKLSAACSKMDEELKALHSVAYEFANHEIIQAMSRVKSQLAMNQTGAATQFEQQQIASELATMIKDLDLKPKPPKPKKDNKSSGGGGAEGPPPPPAMPAEAELRLVRDLQVIENNATIEAGNTSPPDAKLLLTLADRQGELRKLLNDLLATASKGKTRLPTEANSETRFLASTTQPVNAATTKPRPAPIAATQSAKSDQTTADSPATDSPAVVLRRLGDRMSNARYRLGKANDAGPVTQALQQGILDDLDIVIEASRTPPPPPPKPSPKSSPKKPTTQPKESPKPKPKPDGAAQPQNSEANSKPGKRPGTKSESPKSDTGKQPDPTGDARLPNAGMWGEVTPRQREAVIEGQSEKVLDKYKNLVDDYYRAYSTKGESAK